MAGKRAEAERLSQWLGSCGEIGFPPFEYFEIEAAKILGLAYTDLHGHPAQADLMRIAFTYRAGVNHGEYLREVNPKVQRERKKFSAAIEKAQKT